MKRKNRKECFFGVHFDFHAMPGEEVGQVYEPNVVAKMLDIVKPDYVQCDTKGHAGISSYPTKVGIPADNIKHDVLRMWRDLTKERGIRLYAHHSGLYDIGILKKHPDWGAVDRDGNISTDFVSVFSPYVDEILIPQLLELCDEYEMDGAWIDGECWAAKADYGKYAAKRYFEKTGKEISYEEEDREEYEEFCRQGFRDYVRHYIEVIKSLRPDFEITSNWIFSAYMPEEPQFEPEFLSGDYSPVNSVESARHNGRCLAARGMTWDLMAWGQNAIPSSWKAKNRTTKEYVQYCQEAAQVIAMGGGFQFFNIMYGYGGTLQEWAIPMWGKVAEFCRERENICHGAKQYKEVGVVYPNRKGVSENGALYNRFEFPAYESMCTWIGALSNNQVSASVLYEYQLNEDLTEYKAIVVPSTWCLEEESKARLIQYVKEGGSLILDSQAALHFEDIIVPKIIYSQEPELCFLDGGESLCSVETHVLHIEGEVEEVSGYYYHSNYYDENGKIAAFCQNIGRGKILVTCVDVGGSYSNNLSGAYNQFITNQLQAVGFGKTVEISGSSLVDVILMQKEEQFQINLINMAGNHNVPGVRSFGEIPPVGPLTITFECKNKPSEVIIEPEHIAIDHKYEAGKVVIKLDKLDVHKIIVVKR